MAVPGVAGWPMRSAPAHGGVSDRLAREVLVYNVLDLAARLHLPLLQRLAARPSPRSCLASCAARTLLVPLIYACVRVAGVYIGLAAGATVSWAVGRVMQLPLACGCVSAVVKSCPT